MFSQCHILGIPYIWNLFFCDWLEAQLSSRWKQVKLPLMQVRSFSFFWTWKGTLISIIWIWDHRQAGRWLLRNAYEFHASAHHERKERPTAIIPFQYCEFSKTKSNSLVCAGWMMIFNGRACGLDGFCYCWIDLLPIYFPWSSVCRRPQFLQVVISD